MPSPPLAQLAAFCQDHPLAPKVVFVPSAQAGKHLARVLAAGGPPWANLRLLTPAAWAEYWAGPQLVAAGWHVLGADEEFFLIWEALSAPGRARALGCADRPSPGLARNLAQTLRTLRLNEISPEAVAALDPGAARLKSLADLYRTYGEALAQRRRYDQALLFAEAMGLEGISKGVFAVLGETMLPELAARFVQRCIGTGGYRLHWDTAFSTPPAQSAGARFSALKRLPVPGSQAESGPPLRIWQATGAEAELRAVLRDVLRNRIPVDQVELVYAAEQPYLSLAHATAGELGIEVDAAQGLPPFLSQAGQALLGFFRWIGSGFDPAELADLCRAGLLSGLPELGPVHRLAPLLRQARVQDETAEGEHDDMLPAQSQEKAERMLRARDLLDRLRGLVPEGAEVSLKALAGAGVQFLRSWVPQEREHQRQLAAQLVERLRVLGRVEMVDHPVRLAQRLLNRLEAHLFVDADPRRGCLLVSPLEVAGYAGRKHIYIIGMDEGSFPGKPAEDTLLADAERQLLGLPLQRQRPAEQAWQLDRILAYSPGPVTLVSKRCELQDGRELTPAPLVLRLAEHALHSEIPLVVPDLEAALDQGEALLAGCRGAGGTSQAQVLFPWLAEGEHALREREQDPWGRFSGWLGRLTPELGINRGRQLRSASSLEALMRCPYRYFLRYVLELKGPPDREDPGRWLNPAEFGSALHRLFYRFLSALRERGERPSVEKHGLLLAQVLRELVEELKQDIPVRHEASLRADLRRLERSARIFLRAESRNQEAEVVDLELSFGAGGHDGALFREGVVLALSERLQLRLQGRIDRIDRQGQGCLIWDYKTGSSTPYEGEDLLRGGIHLQWALYAHAFEEVLRQREHEGVVSSAGYFFVGAREHGRQLAAPPPAPGRVAGLLAPVVEMVDQGAFFHLQKERQCLHCDYASLCSGEASLPADVGPEVEVPGRPALTTLLRQWASA